MAQHEPIGRVLPGKKTAIRHREYGVFLDGLKRRIQTAQMRAALAVNEELLQLYWDIGRAIAQKQEQQGWGNGVVERVARDLKRAFPSVAGFSASNIWRMRAFYRAYSNFPPILAQPVREPPGPPFLAQSVREMASPFDAHPTARPTRTPLTPHSPDELVPQPFGKIPWGHNIALIESTTDPLARAWYARQAIANGWSRNMLQHWIDEDLFSRQGAAVTNFKTTLPPPQSDLAQQVLKDPYNFDFLSLRTEAAEHDMEDGLLGHIAHFLLELGDGFAFVGRQVPVHVDGEDFRIDLLFYHLQLRAFIVIDLKIGRFEPEFAGKMNFYLSAVDDLMRKPSDAPSIGLILCKDRSKVIAEYALRHLRRPVGVARYLTRLTSRLPKNLAANLPTAKQLEREISGGVASQQRRKKLNKAGKRRPGG